MIRQPEKTDQYWKRVWNNVSADHFILKKERSSKRFKIVCDFIRTHYGGFNSLRVEEIGSGIGYNGFLFAQKGAKVTLIDSEPVALEKAKSLFYKSELKPFLICGDLFQLQEIFSARFDIVMSYGLIEHFIGDKRREIISVHLKMTKPGGIIIISTPYRYSPLYRLQKATLEILRKWKTGYTYFSRSGTSEREPEYPFSKKELLHLTDDLPCAYRKVTGVAFLEPLDDFLKFFRYPLEKFNINFLAKHLYFPDVSLSWLDEIFGKHLVFLAIKD